MLNDKGGEYHTLATHIIVEEPPNTNQPERSWIMEISIKETYSTFNLVKFLNIPDDIFRILLRLRILSREKVLN